MSKPISTFGKRFNEALTIRNMKPIEIANKLDLNKGIISKYLNDKYKPKQDRIFQIANILDVNEVWLMGYDVPMEEKIETIDKLELRHLLTNMAEDTEFMRKYKEYRLEDLIKELGGK